jgi:hypothetical protein
MVLLGTKNMKNSRMSSHEIWGNSTLKVAKSSKTLGTCSVEFYHFLQPPSEITVPYIKCLLMKESYILTMIFMNL